MPSGISVVSSFLMEFGLSECIDDARGQMTEIESGIEEWFSTLRDWLEVGTLQDLSIESPAYSQMNLSNHVWSWRSGDTWRNTTQASTLLTLVMPNKDLAVTLDYWKHALDAANRRMGPPAAHLLLRDARRAMDRRQYGYAVIHAGTAAEVVLKGGLVEHLQSIGNPPKFVERTTKGSLGSIVAVALSLDMDIPAEINDRLVGIRNRAVHQNEKVSNQEAREALRIASEVVCGRIRLPDCAPLEIVRSAKTTAAP